MQANFRKERCPAGNCLASHTSKLMTSEVLMVVTTKIIVFWDVTLCSLIDELHFYLSTRLQSIRYQKTVIVQMLTCFMYGHGVMFASYELPYQNHPASAKS